MPSEATEQRVNEIANDAWSQMYVEELKAINAAELQSIRASLIINGGAAVALLGFLASTINAKSTGNISDFAYGLIIYVAGVLAAAVSYWAVYFAQSNHSRYRYNNKLKHRKTVSAIFEDVAIVLIAGSYSFFGYGGWLTYQALLLAAKG